MQSLLASQFPVSKRFPMLELDEPDEPVAESAELPIATGVPQAPRSASEAASEAAGTTRVATAEVAQTEVDEPDEPGEPLTFREHLWDRFDVIWGWRMGPSRRMLEGFVCCMRERAQLERQYARGLLHSVTKLQQTTSEGAVPLPLEAVVSNLRHRAEQCAVLAEELDQEQLELEDELWKTLMQEDWRPGYVGESTTSLPIRDLTCQGPGTRLRSIPGCTWVMVKGLLQGRSPANEVLRILTRIQMDEPDDCALGIVTSSSFLLPYTMPKFRNMARTLSGDLNFLLLNVTFFDTLTSGFPIFGIYDDLSSVAYRSWFQSTESTEYFEPPPESAACRDPTAQVLQEKLQEQREEWQAATRQRAGGDFDGEIDGFLEAIEILDGFAGECRPAAAAAALVLALSRGKAIADEPAKVRNSKAKRAALRDVIELVTKAEDLLKDYSWHEGVAFGRLVASDWNFWWLLQQLQIVLKKLFPGLWAEP
eukprot:s1298_g5.t1